MYVMNPGDDEPVTVRRGEPEQGYRIPPPPPEVAAELGTGPAKRAPIAQDFLDGIRATYATPKISGATLRVCGLVYELLDEIERLRDEQKSPAFDVTKLTPGQLFGVDCVTCGSSEQPMRPVGIHNGVQLFACTSHDEQPAAEDWTPSKGTEYHWMLCYIVPQVPYGFDARQQSGVITLTDETRAQAVEKLALRVAKEDGLSVGDFSVTSFSLEPNRLRPAAWGVMEWYTEPAPYVPQRGDAVEAWLTAHRDRQEDEFGTNPAWYAYNTALLNYQAHADYGLSLDEPLPDPDGDDSTDPPAAQAQDGPCCDRRDIHIHCKKCGEPTGMYGHLVGDRIICDPGERRAYRVELALRPSAGGRR